MGESKVTESGWYRTRDGRDAEVVVFPTRQRFNVYGYIFPCPTSESWDEMGFYDAECRQHRNDLVEYLGKERPKEPKKYKTTVVLYADGRATLDGILCESHPLKPSPKVVKTQVIEWEVPDNG